MLSDGTFRGPKLKINSTGYALFIIQWRPVAYKSIRGGVKDYERLKVNVDNLLPKSSAFPLNFTFHEDNPPPTHLLFAF